MSKYVGIDPGRHGAIAAIDDDGKIEIWPMPVNTFTVGKKQRWEYDKPAMVDILEDLAINDHISLLVIEEQHPFPKQGVVSVCSICRGFGIWEGIAAAFKIPHQSVNPRKWQKQFFAGVGGNEAKLRALKVAQSLFGGQYEFTKKTDGATDAALIAEYGRREHG